MPASYLNTWAPAVVAAASAEILAQIDASATAATINIYDESDSLLAQFTLTNPAGTVDGTGKITLGFSATTTAGLATGVASYATIKNGDDEALHSVPCVQGSESLAWFCVLSTTTIVEDKIVGIESWEIVP